MKQTIRIKKKNIICLIILILLVVITVLFKIFLSDKNKIIGVWTIDNITTYEFKKNNCGKLIVSLTEYEFIYKLKNNNLYIDFVNEKSEDTKYSYNINKNKLILSSENGTFIFNKKYQ